MGGIWQLLLVGLVMGLGVVGVIVPGVPGRWLIWAAMLWWSLQEQTRLAWVLLVASTALFLVVQVILWLMPTRLIRESGATVRMAAFAGVGAIVGFFAVPVIGAIPGFVGGIYLCERQRLGGHGQAAASTRTAMRGAGTSVLVELFACLLVMGAWMGAVIWG
ncbi:DUF456 domain-containing protein [Streptomyces sp. NPDC004838]